jgi:hypothetical protein
MPDHEEASARASAALSWLPYPIAKDEAILAAGDWDIPIAKGRSVPLRDVLSAIPRDDFESPEDAMRAIDKHWGRIATALQDERFK